MKALKKFFSIKIYLWAIILFVIAIIGSIGYGYTKYQEDQKLKSSSSVLYLEKVNEMVFLNIGIEKVISLSDSTKFLGYKIPNTKKTKIVQLSYIGKFGIKEPVKIKNINKNRFLVEVPEFKKIGIDIAPGKFIHPYNGEGELLSYSTPEIDSSKAVNKTFTKKETSKYLKKYNTMLKESATDYYKNLFSSINKDYTVQVHFNN